MHFSSANTRSNKIKKTFSLFALLTLALVAHAADPIYLKTGREIFASYVSITGVSENDPDVVVLYRQDIDRLPEQGLPSEISSNTVLALTELGGVFCQKALQREQAMQTAERYMFNELDFTKGPSQLNDYVTGNWLERLALVFWQRDITDSEKQALMNAVNTAVAGADDTADQTVNVAQMICGLYASSLSFLIK